MTRSTTIDACRAEFKAALEAGDKPSSVLMALEWLSNGVVSVPTLYEEVLTPVLNGMTCATPEGKWCVWLEHARTAIVRTIIENTYPYALAERDAGGPKPFGGRAIIACPPGETHELGARMVSDYFTILGFDSVFMGSDTPREDLVDAVRLLKPGFVALSVTSPLNLVEAKWSIELIRSRVPLADIPRIIVGGHAFDSNRHAVHTLGAYAYAGSFDDIAAIVEGVVRHG